VDIHIVGFKVNAIDHSSVLNMGSTQHVDIFVSYKRSQGVGEQNGDLSPMLLPVSWVTDQDIIDSPTVKNSLV
jgi:hypothetical protein